MSNFVVIVPWIDQANPEGASLPVLFNRDDMACVALNFNDGGLGLTVHMRGVNDDASFDLMEYGTLGIKDKSPMTYDAVDMAFFSELSQLLYAAILDPKRSTIHISEVAKKALETQAGIDLMAHAKKAKR